MIPEAVDYRLQVPVVARPDYTISLSRPAPEFAVVHCEVRKWGRGVARHLAQDWAVLRALHGGPLHALHTPPDLKHHKFLTMFGMRPHSRYVDAVSGNPTIIYRTPDGL